MEAKLNDCIPSEKSHFDTSGDVKVELDALKIKEEPKVEVKKNLALLLPHLKK